MHFRSVVLGAPKEFSRLYRFFLRTTPMYIVVLFFSPSLRMVDRAPSSAEATPLIFAACTVRARVPGDLQVVFVPTTLYPQRLPCFWLFVHPRSTHQNTASQRYRLSLSVGYRLLPSSLLCSLVTSLPASSFSLRLVWTARTQTRSHGWRFFLVVRFFDGPRGAGVWCMHGA